VANKVTFGEIHRLLDGLGFVQIPARRPAVLFEHKPSDTLLIFRPHRPGEQADAVTVSVVRKMLDEKGLLDREDFDEALREASANGKADSRRK
jgi:hypothetical protein